MMPRVRCPRCSTAVEVAPGQKPVCPNCGFGSKPKAAAPPPGPDLDYDEPAPAPKKRVVGTPAKRVVGAPAPAREAAPEAFPEAGPTGAQVGKRRSFWVTLLLGIITLGIYFWVYYWKVYKEHDDFHGRDHEKNMYIFGLILSFLWILSIVGFILMLVYHARELRKLNEYRAMRGLEAGITGKGYVLWSTLGVLILIGPYIALYKLNKSARGLWDKIYAEQGIPLN